MTGSWFDQADVALLQHSTAAQRNAGAILDKLRTRLPQDAHVLEVASGTGQHAAHFSAAMPDWTWQPTDRDAQSFGSIAAWCRQQNCHNVRAPYTVDVLSAAWMDGSGPDKAAAWHAVYCANMLHIAPWDTCNALFQGAIHRLKDAGQVVIYGPFLERNVPTVPSNLAFDQSLRERNPQWGVRWLDAVVDQAQGHGMQLQERIAMPANNLLLTFVRQTV